MSISPLESSFRASLPVQPEVTQGHRQERPSLEMLADSASLSNLPARHRAVLDELASADSNLPEALASNVDRLQDAFVDELYRVLEGLDADLTAKLTLRLEGETLLVDGDHPQGRAIESALADRPELGRAFGEIGAQSELLRDIRNIGSVMAGRSGAMAAYAEASVSGPASAFQISLKGEMSHFYFGRGR